MAKAWGYGNAEPMTLGEQEAGVAAAFAADGPIDIHVREIADSLD